MTIKEIIKKENLQDKNVLIQVRCIDKQNKGSYLCGWFGMNKGIYEYSPCDSENWDDIIDKDVIKYEPYISVEIGQYDSAISCEYDLERSINEKNNINSN